MQKSHRLTLRGNRDGARRRHSYAVASVLRSGRKCRRRGPAPAGAGGVEDADLLLAEQVLAILNVPTAIC